MHHFIQYAGGNFQTTSFGCNFQGWIDCRTRARVRINCGNLGDERSDARLKRFKMITNCTCKKMRAASLPPKKKGKGSIIFVFDNNFSCDAFPSLLLFLEKWGFYTKRKMLLPLIKLYVYSEAFLVWKLKWWQIYFWSAKKAIMLMKWLLYALGTWRRINSCLWNEWVWSKRAEYTSS